MSDTKSHLGKLLEEIQSIDTAIPPARGWRKLDSQDTELGTLSVEMQQLWLHCQVQYQVVEDLAQKVEDLWSVHLVEHEQLGDTITEEACKATDAKAGAILEQLKVPHVLYEASNDMFNALLRLDFPAADGKEVLGIREGFKVVCRDDNARGDRKHPLDGLRKLAEKMSGDTILQELLFVMKHVVKKKAKATEPAATPTETAEAK